MRPDDSCSMLLERGNHKWSQLGHSCNMGEGEKEKVVGTTVLGG